MQPVHFEEVLEKILHQDHRYQRPAYAFIREALDFTQKQICKNNKNQIRHITGQELLAGIRDYALQQYGPMALTLLKEWGIQRCEDFGEIVFAMVDFGLLNKTESDSREDFKTGYDFRDAFVRPFVPDSKASPGPSPSTIERST